VEVIIDRLAHDLRAPLRSVAAAAAWIVEDLGRDPPPDLKNSVDILDNSVRRMERMLDALLTIARAGQPEPGDAFGAAEAIGEVEIHGLTIDVEGDARLTGDRVAFVATARELLDNAHRHSKRDATRATVTIAGTEGTATITIADDGEAMTDYVRSNAMHLFYSRYGASNAKHVGCGLPIATAHAEAHGGTVELGPERSEGNEVRLRWQLA
jgi:signal transduction histidine kinase